MFFDERFLQNQRPNEMQKSLREFITSALREEILKFHSYERFLYPKSFSFLRLRSKSRCVYTLENVVRQRLYISTCVAKLKDWWPDFLL